MMVERPGYLAYMLRMWRVDTEEGTVWRASVESPHTGERQGFANLQLLFAFLEEKIGGDVHGAQPRMKAEPSEEGGGE
jgi:hypothetical protein